MRATLVPHPLVMTTIDAIAATARATKIVPLRDLHWFDTVRIIDLSPLSYLRK
jgi:hypothetical protein